MEDIVYTNIQEFLDNEFFLNSFCYISKNIYLNNRRKHILKNKSTSKLKYILSYLKDEIIDKTTGKLDNDFNSKYGSKMLFSYLSYDFLMYTRFEIKYNKKIRIKIKSARSSNFMRIIGKPTINDFESEIFINSYYYIDSIYRMKPFYKKKLIKYYPNVAALIY